MKILHVIRGLANSSGTTHIVGPLAEEQARLGHKVDVFFVEKYGEEAVLPDPDLVRSHGFPMTVRSLHYGWSRTFRRGIREIIPKTDVAHIHAIWNYPTWCAMREAHSAGVPYMVAPQGSLDEWALERSRHMKRLYAALIEKPLFDRAACMQALTGEESEQCRRFGIRAPTALLPNGVDLETIDYVEGVAGLHGELGLPAEEVLILFLGRLFPKKGIDLLISSFGDVARTNGDVSLLIAGHDAGTGYLQELKSLAKDTGAEGKIHFLGEVRGQRKFQVLKGADLFALTSHSEGLPVAVLEAMACGLPVVVTPGCNIPDVADRMAGWPTGMDVEDIARTLIEAVSDKKERKCRGENARKLVEEKFTWQGIAKKSIEIYQGLSGAGHS